MSSLTDREKEIVERRRDYYLCFKDYRIVPPDYRLCGEEKPSIVLKRDFVYPWHKKKKFSAYFLDLYRAVGILPDETRMAYLFGDITEEYDFPFFTKTRPIRYPSNSVLMKLDSERHFQWVNDKTPFADKKDMAVSRNIVRRQPWRATLLEKFCQHPLCDFGMVNSDAYVDHPEWVKPFMTKQEQLQYKFIMCIEGHDVATNLKWVMSSNSVAVMPRPRYESWFMEGTLIPDYHYIEINPDYSDLIDKIRYYTEHPEVATSIVQHAHEYVSQFRNDRIELATEISVAYEYLNRTNQ